MDFTDDTKLDSVMGALFTPYKQSVTDVQKVIDALLLHAIISSEDEIVNDHIAFRTLGVPNLGITSFEKLFLHYGYVKKDYYYFKEKKLNAYWYAPPSPKYPRIFISELRVDDLPEKAKTILNKYTKDILQDPVDSIDLNNVESVGNFFYKPLWDLPTITDYQELQKISEYAAWVLYNRYYLNHYTISVHDLKQPYNSLESFNKFLTSIGITLNTAGGVIKTSADGLLKQTSSVAKMIDAIFKDGEHLEISGSYVEFAERLPYPKSTNENEPTRRRDGFESANADKIFESTYSSQTDNKTD